MAEWHPVARVLVFVGAALVVVGVLFQVLSRVQLPFTLGRLPGDIVIERENFTFYFPLGTMILISLGLTLLLNLLARLFGGGGR